MGIDRSQAPVELSGSRYNGQGAPIEETLQLALTMSYMEEATPDTIVLNPYDMARAMIGLQSKVVRDDDGGTATIGYQRIKIASLAGITEVMADPGCPRGRAYVLDMKTWELHTLGKWPSLDERDGLPIVRDPADDAFTWRYYEYGNLVCTRPRGNMSVTL